MRDDLPTIIYERGINHNYMVLSKCDFFGAEKEGGRNYRVRMLLENRIPGLLPITQRQVNGESKYYYEINSLQPLARLMEKSALKYEELKSLFLGCINIFDRLEEYLLDGGQVIIKSDFIYVNVESMEPYFVCYPDYTGDVRLSFVEFIDELLTHIDHMDEQAVMLGYQVYRYTRNPNYVISEIKKFMEYAANESIKTGTVKEASVFADVVLTEDSKNKHFLDEESDSFAYVPENMDFAENESDISNKKSGIKYLIGGSVGLFTAACAGVIVACARFLKLFRLGEGIELYICGAAVAALPAAALCFACYIKEARQKKEIEDLNETGYEAEERNVYRELIERDIVNNLTNTTEVPIKTAVSSETVCLGNEAPEERILRGRVNGMEVNVSLEKLPMTIGKLAGMSDFVINDTSVSKMHARFEERNGKVCVCDLNSTNGTVRNGEILKINTPVFLEPGDRLRFGRSCFTYL